MSEDTTETVEDFDEFWSTRKRRKRSTTIMGVKVDLLPSLPLEFEMEAKRLQRSKREKDVKHLLAILFGDDALAQWSKNGMDLEQFMVLLAWAPQVIAGRDVTLAEVADAVAEKLAEEGGESGEA